MNAVKKVAIVAIVTILVAYAVVECVVKD